MQFQSPVDFFRFLAPLDDAEAAFVTTRFSSLDVSAKQMILQPNAVCQHIYFVKKGCLRVAIQDQSGDDISCYFAPEGRFAANYESFISGKPSPYGIQTLEDSQLMMLDRKGLDEIYSTVKNGEKIGRLIAEMLFVDTLNRLTSFYTESPEERYNQFLTEFPGLSTRIAQHHIASYIGVRPQSLSRIKRRLSQALFVNPG